MSEIRVPHDHRHDGHRPGEYVPLRPGSTDPAEVGRWERIEAEFANAATHVALLPTNKIFAYGGSSLDESALHSPPPPELLDLATMTTRRLDMAGVDLDLWCGGHTLLADGRLLFAGGTKYYPRGISPFFGGHRQSYIFDPFTETWERQADMHEARWYPTLIRLPDESVLAFSGTRDRFPEHWQRRHERFVLGHGWQKLPQKKFFPLYPRLHLLPDGNVFYPGIFNAHYEIPWAFPSALYDVTTQRWRNLGGKHNYAYREEGISLLLALRPPDYRPEVLVIGGGHHNRFRSILDFLSKLGLEKWLDRFRDNRALDTVERIDLSQPNPVWAPNPKMHSPRLHAVGVLLPTGQILVVGGMHRHSSHDHHAPAPGGVGTAPGETAVLAAELYDPDRWEWQVMAAQSRARVYHSTAMLLPDGRVISMGSNPYARVIEPAIEIYSPPYLFRGDRPVITRATEKIPYAAPFEVGVNRAAAVEQVVLTRPEVLTHVTSTDQRVVELSHRRLADDRLEVIGPPDRAHVPAGYCLLFVVNADGVPSEGKFVHLT